MAKNRPPGIVDNTKGVVPYLAPEVTEFEAEALRYKKGEIEDAVFTPWRLRRGVYGQRQPDAQMMRIKIPGGLANAEQLEALADIAEQFTPMQKGHITTRENIQFHHIPLENTGTVMRILGDVGLSTREACGNTVRNVIADPLVGIDPRQAFDVIPYLVAFVRYFIRHPVAQNMPRKFKPAFSSGEHDPALTQMHDIGFIARIKTIDGVDRKGFKVVVGGGTSIMAKLAETLYEFVLVEDYLKVTEAILRIFDRSEELRRNKMMARIKVLVHRKGIDSLRTEIEQEMEQPWATEGSFDPTPLMEFAKEYPPSLSPIDTEPQTEDPRFLFWKATNVLPQLQDGYSVAMVKVFQGDLNPLQFRELARIAATYGAGTVAFSAEQNLALRWIPNSVLPRVWKELEQLGLSEPEIETITDVTSCPGTDSCKLGITSSMGLSRAVSEAVNNWTEVRLDPLINKLHIKASGCPNGCGRHHVANIGFHGASIKGPGGEQIPAYELFLAGNYDDGRVRYGDRIKAKVPAKEVPNAIHRVLGFYQDQRNSEEEFNDFVQRVGTDPFEAILSEFRDVGPLNNENLSFYMDWGKTVLYKLERGEGECAV